MEGFPISGKRPLEAPHIPQLMRDHVGSKAQDSMLGYGELLTSPSPARNWGCWPGLPQGSYADRCHGEPCPKAGPAPRGCLSAHQEHGAHNLSALTSLKLICLVTSVGASGVNLKGLPFKSGAASYHQACICSLAGRPYSWGWGSDAPRHKKGVYCLEKLYIRARSEQVQNLGLE